MSAALLRCLIVDDEPLARRLLADYVEKVPFLTLQGAYASPLLALEELRAHPPDLLLLDVQMPDLTGLELLRVLPRPPLVVLTTAYSHYALDGYELDVVDYLLKPVTLERFLRAAHKARARLLPAAAPAPPEAPEFLFVKDGGRRVKVRYDELLYVEGLRDYVTLHGPPPENREPAAPQGAGAAAARPPLRAHPPLLHHQLGGHRRRVPRQGAGRQPVSAGEQVLPPRLPGVHRPVLFALR